MDRALFYTEKKDKIFRNGLKLKDMQAEEGATCT